MAEFLLGCGDIKIDDPQRGGSIPVEKFGGFHHPTASCYLRFAYPQFTPVGGCVIIDANNQIFSTFQITDNTLYPKAFEPAKTVSLDARKKPATTSLIKKGPPTCKET